MHAGRVLYQQDYKSGWAGKTVHSRSGRDLPPHRPRKVFDRDTVVELHRQGSSMRAIAKGLMIELGTVSRILKERSKSCSAERKGRR